MRRIYNLLQKSLLSSFLILASTPVKAQITPDNTLGKESSQLNQNVLINGLNADKIDGGATRGSNLFHSFSQFNINDGQRVYFANPSGVLNILSRVTGGSASNILGTLGVDGAANLFLMNPNGILFGQNASLDVRGSFVGTTANALAFGNQGVFSATNPEAPPLLTINPSALLFNQINRSGIINRSRQIATPGSFYLIGGDIIFDSGVAASLGNRLELGAVAGKGTVELIGSGNQMQLAFPESLPKADIVLQNNAFALTIGGGAISINSGNLSLFGNSFISAVLFAGEGQSGLATGDVIVNATGDVTLDNVSNITSRSGDIELQTRSLTLTNGGNVGTQSSGRGNSGNLLVNASDSVTLSGITTLINPQNGETITTGSRLATSAFGNGNSGQLTINTQRLSIKDGGDITTTSGELGRGGNLTINAKDFLEVVGRSPNSPSTISTSSFGTGDAGSLNISAGHLSIRDGAQVSTGTSGAGKGGNLTVNASGSVEVIGASATGLLNSRLSTSANQGLTGNAGDLTINTQNLLVRDGGLVDAVTSGQGKGGNLTVNATGKVEAIGTSVDGGLPTIFSTSAQLGSTGDAGDLTINAQHLFIRDGAQIGASTFDMGKAGNLTVNASKKVELSGANADGRFVSGLGASVQQGSTGNAGSLTIKTQDLLVRDGARVSTATLGAGRAGDLTINAENLVELIGTSVDGSYGGLIAAAGVGSIGDAGNLKITTQNLLVRDGAQVLASTFSSGRGGNLTVNASESVQLIGQSANSNFLSGLFASSEKGATGNAGNLTVNTQSLLVRDGAQVIASTFNSGKGGNSTVNADSSIQLIGKSANNEFSSGLFASAERNSTGDAGDLNVNTRNLLVRDGAGVFVNSSGTGNAGILTINANTTRLDNKASLNANTRSPNKDPNREQATINLNSPLIILRRGSNITTNATGENVIGGNINIDSDIIAAFENSDISANSTDSRGGRVKITTQGIFGTQPRNAPTPESDITATGASPDLSGTTEINTPDVDPIQGLIELPQQVVDASNKISQLCPRGAEAFRRPLDKFVVTGRGSLPPNPLQPLPGKLGLRQLAFLDEKTGGQEGQGGQAERGGLGNSQVATTTIIEAQGFVKAADGTIMLVAQVPNVVIPSSHPITSVCPVSK